MRHLRADPPLKPSLPGAAPAAGALPYLATAGFASMGSIRAADAMLPALAHDFGRVPADTAAVITAFALAYGLMQLVWGPLGDRIGKLRVIGWAALAATLGSLACAFAPTLPLLTAARLLTGACCAAIIPLAIAHVGDTVAYEVRQATLARLATGTLTGLIAGQVLGGLAADTVGWRAAFGVLALLFLVAGAAVLRLHARQPRTGSASTDAEPGASAASGAPASPVPGGLAALVRGYGRVLATGWARTVLAVAFLEGALLFGPLAFVPTWLHQRTGVTLAAAGAVVAAVGVGGLLYTFTARRWIAALGERGLATLGASLIAVAFAVLIAGVGASAGRPLEVVACLVVGVGFYMLHNTLQTLATQLAPGARATAIGLFAVALFMGQSAGVELTAWLGPWLGFEAVFVGASLLLALTGAAFGVGISRRRA